MENDAKSSDACTQKFIKFKALSDETCDYVVNESDQLFKQQCKIYSDRVNGILEYQEELKQYHKALKIIHESSDKLFQSFRSLHETFLSKDEEINEIIANITAMWAVLISTLNVDVILPLNSEVETFSEINGEIVRRGRKLVNSCRDRTELEDSVLSNQFADEPEKLNRLTQKVEESEKSFILSNKDLLHKFPFIFQNQNNLYLENFYKVLVKTSYFHSEMSKLHSQLADYVLDLQMKSGFQEALPVKYFSISKMNLETEEEKTSIDDHLVKPETKHGKVKAISSFISDTDDEMTFHAGDIINVLPYEGSTKETDGWIMGWNTTTGRKGIFPTDLTIPI